MAWGFRLGLLMAVFLGVSGCGSGSKEAANSVSGTVKVGSESVTSGEVVFVGSDNKQVPAPIKTDGTYVINDPPTGEVKILVRTMGGGVGGGAAIQPKDAPAMSGSKGANPPPKYASLTTTDLKFTVQSGKQKYDIEMKP